jgi:hypothetical protein
MGILDDIQNGRPVVLEPKLDFSMLVKAINESTKVTNSVIDDLKARATKLLSEDKPPQLPATAPLQYLMTERQARQDMEDGTWQMSIIIETLKIDDLVKPTDFANNVAYQNHKAHIARTTPADTFPGFRIKVKVGQATSGKRVIMPCTSKEEVMHSRQFISALVEILALIKAKTN